MNRRNRFWVEGRSWTTDETSADAVWSLGSTVKTSVRSRPVGVRGMFRRIVDRIRKIFGK